MKLETIVERYVAARELSETNPDDGPALTRAGRAIAVRQAQDDLEILRQQYEAELKNHVLPVFLFGPEKSQQELAALGAQGDILSVDGMAMYRRFVDRIVPTLGDNPEPSFGVEQFSSLIAELRNIGFELGIVSFTAPKLLQTELIDGEKGLLQIIHRLIFTAVGYDIWVRYLTKQIVDQALADHRGDEFLPVFVTGLDEETALGLGGLLFSGHFADFELKPGDKVDKNLLDKVVETIAQKATEMISQ